LWKCVQVNLFQYLFSTSCQYRQVKRLFQGNIVCKSPNLRLFGTNLFDFSPVVSATGGAPYRFQGKVSYIYPESIRVTRLIGTEIVYTQPTLQEIVNSPPGDMVKRLYAAGVAQHGASLGQIMSMSPDVRQNFQAVEKTSEFYLLNYPFAIQVGSSIDCLALPTTTKGFWDYGKPFSGDTSEFKIIYRVRPTGIVAEKQYSPEEKLALKQAADAKTIAWLLSQATNGIASAECSLGLRYLNGQGVETNKTLAIEWLKKAAEHGDTVASNRLDQLATIQTNFSASVKSP
jgi:TPR repeat protein